ncbi:MAG: hypothetical protein JOY94_20595 [Methylobacteriaceae bacterium]|nr:hypothetical protein [Methylobacteriaceae bacterium]
MNYLLEYQTEAYLQKIADYFSALRSLLLRADAELADLPPVSGWRYCVDQSELCLRNAISCDGADCDNAAI